MVSLLTLTAQTNSRNGNFSVIFLLIFKGWQTVIVNISTYQITHFWRGNIFFFNHDYYGMFMEGIYSVCQDFTIAATLMC